MSRSAQSQNDLTKVAKAMAKTMAKVGLKGWRVEIEQGKITFVVASEQAGHLAPTVDDLDRELADFEARHAG
jgi:hypothetical protein